jgi:diguanylate cyclase (GGDEF)-like protein
MAGLISAVLTLRTHGTTTTNLSDIRATPLILLATGLVMRLAPLEVMTTAGVSISVFICSILLAPSVPGAELGSLVLMELAIGAAAVVFNLQLETRDRRLFLLRISDRIQRAELAARNRGLLKEIQTDGLTGAANRRFFDETLHEVWQRAQLDGGEVSLIMMDVDHFKDFNDHYGHHKGDECLRLVAAQARREVRGNDLFARYGGEEFAVILPYAPAAIANAVAERMRAAVEAMALPHAGLRADAIVTLSLGVATLRPGRQDDARQLVEVADSNLYTAKRTGRNMVCVQELAEAVGDMEAPRAKRWRAG